MSRNKDFHITHISFGFLVMSIIASKFLRFNSSRNAILSNDLSLRMSIVFYFLYPHAPINKDKFMVTDTTSDHPAFGYIFWFICGNVIDQCSRIRGYLGWLCYD